MCWVWKDVWGYVWICKQQWSMCYSFHCLLVFNTHPPPITVPPLSPLLQQPGAKLPVPRPTQTVYTLLFTCCDSTHTPSVNNGPLITVLSLLLSCNQVQNFPFPSPPEPSALKAAHACLEALSALNPGGCERCGDGCVPGVCGWCSGA